MAEAGARHDGERHGADGADGPGVNAGTAGDKSERSGSGQEKADRDESVGDVQDENQARR